MREKVIFVIDDDPDQAELLAHMVGERGRRVHVYTDPIRALATLNQQGADLLIADLSMPWIGGEDVIAAARDRWPQLHIFLVSGYARGAEIAARRGIRFFAKPIDFAQLRQAVNQVLV
ncbi:MAG: response regulator [Myxococcales bacterium]|nr:response regulator [Myxococcota bacterium]MDW8281425.1 response regulator [Myxococcales bacterium]